LFLGPLERTHLLSQCSRDHLRRIQLPEQEMMQTLPHGLSTLQLATIFDFNTYLVDDLLVKIDRASMLASLEVRSPWLDHKVIEFAFGKVPDPLKATRTERKILPKIFGRQLLPDSFDFSRKRGFSVPLRRWFRGGLGDHVRTILNDCDPDLFDQKAMRNLIAKGNRSEVPERLLGLAMFELWRQDYNVKGLS
jgi:asparagine synthase (glutamine-hydrolysing)